MVLHIGWCMMTQRAHIGANNGIKLFGYNSGSIICVNDLCNTHTYDYTVCFVMNMRRECCNCNALKPFPLSLDLTWEDKQDFTLGEPVEKISFNLFWFVCNWRLPTVPSNPIVTMSIPAPALSLKVCSLETKFAASYICVHDDDHLTIICIQCHHHDDDASHRVWKYSLSKKVFNARQGKWFLKGVSNSGVAELAACQPESSPPSIRQQLADWGQAKKEWYSWVT